MSQVRVLFEAPQKNGDFDTIIVLLFLHTLGFQTPLFQANLRHLAHDCNSDLSPEDFGQPGIFCVLWLFLLFLRSVIVCEKGNRVREAVIVCKKFSTHNIPYEKVGDNEPVSIADELPFDIPDSWEWVRLDSLVSKEIRRGKSPKYSQTKGIQVFAQKCNTKAGHIDMTLAKYLDVSTFQRYPKEEYLQDQDIIINSTGNGTLGRIGVFRDSDRIDDSIIVPDSHVTIVRLLSSINQRYILNVLRYYQPYLEKQGEGSTNQTELKPAIISSLLIPIPPAEEQDRISAKIEEVQPLIITYGGKETELSEYNLIFPEQLKKSILQLAVQGKLVPQDPKDEPASVLLERIRVEKERLIAEGKIKRDKHESVIFRWDNSHYEKRDGIEVCIDDEIPFEIPASWEWIRLDHICNSIADGDHQPPPQAPSGVPFLVISNVSTGTIDFSNTRFVNYQYFSSLSDIRIPEDGDLLFTVTGSFGIVIPVKTNRQFCFQRHIALLKFSILSYEFLHFWLSSPHVYEQCKKVATGTAQKTVGLSSLKNILIPLPPLDEQSRIVNMLQKVLPLIAL